MDKKEQVEQITEKIKQKKVDRCYSCDDPILNSKDLVIKPIPLVMRNGKKKNYNRKFHEKCLQPYLNGRANTEFIKVELDHWVELCEFVKKEVLQQTQPLSDHMIERLRGAHIGKYKAKGVNQTRLNPDRVYSYKMILFVFKKQLNKIRHHIKITNFADEKHMIDSIFVIFITKSLPYIKRQLAEKERQKKKAERVLDQVDVSGFRIEDHKKKDKKSSEIDNKVGDLFDDF